MGLIKATFKSAGGVMADQWKEYFYCDSLNADIIVKEGIKNNKSKNNNGNDNVITHGSTIVVNEGQAMMIVDNGEIVEFSAEAGEFTYDSSTEPTCLDGGFFKGVSSSFKKFKKRFTYGGEVPKTQKIYYINTKELTGKKFGTASPVVYDDPVYQSISIRYYGVSSLRIIDPIRFFVKVCGNVDGEFSIDSLWENQLLYEFNSTLSQSLARLALDGKKYTQIPQSQNDISKYMNDILDEEWIEKRGLEVVSVAVAQVTLMPEDKEKVDKIDEMRLLSNSQLAAGRLAGAQANAMENAAKNSGGSMAGFMGLNFANQAGGINANNLFGNGQGVVEQPKSQPVPVQNSNTWQCSCGNTVEGKFCSECGAAKPVTNTEWQCSCGNKAEGKFCSECGAKRPEDNTWQCSCGNKVEGKFCSECGAERS